MSCFCEWWAVRLGIQETKVEVRFEDLTVEADVREGGRALPTLVNAVINTMQVITINDLS